MKNSYDVKSLKRSIALAISGFTSPYFFLMFAVFIANYEIAQDKGPLLAFIVIGSFLPVLIYIKQIYRYKSHFLKYISVPRKERAPIYLAAVFSFMANTIVFTRLENLYWIYTSILFVVFFGMMYVVTKFIDKASMHVGAFAFGVIYLIDKSGIFYSILFATLPLIYWARIKLHKHSWDQLFIGTMIGLLVGLFSWLF